MTSKEFIEKARLVHGSRYDYSKVADCGYNTKITIICPVHGEFLQLCGNHLRGQGCKLCRVENDSLTTEEFINRANIIHENYYSYDKTLYVSAHKKVIITCPVHGDFYIIPNNHLHGCGCKKCKRPKTVKTFNTHKSTDTQSFIELAKQVHGDKYDYSKVKYVNKVTPVKILCKIHGEFLLKPDDHLHKKAGCWKCAKNYLPKDKLIQTFNSIHNNKYTYLFSDYSSLKTKINIVCPHHGVYTQSVGAHLKGHGCPKCRLKSQTKFFNKLQERFPHELMLFEVGKETVSWIQSLRLDIYFPKYNIAIEYDGELHFRPIDRFGGELRFARQLYLDRKKSILCKLNGCELIRVPYNYSLDDFVLLCKTIETLIK